MGEIISVVAWGVVYTIIAAVTLAALVVWGGRMLDCWALVNADKELKKEKLIYYREKNRALAAARQRALEKEPSSK
jgi:hypothetical protein